MEKMFRIVGLLLICWVLHGCGSRATNNILAETQVTSETKKTQVVIVGTIHNAHQKNPKYSSEDLKEIILFLKPHVILNELPLSQVDPSGRPLFRDPNKHPECWAADTVAGQLGIKQIPFDRPDRQENFRKTKFFEKQKCANQLQKQWRRELKKENSNSADLKTARLWDYTANAEMNLFLKSSPEIINSDAHDSMIRIKHSLWYDIFPNHILPKYSGYEELIELCHFARDRWNERNRIMADNIIKAAKKYPRKRLVVLTGATHRYMLQDLLKDEKSIELKEFWEVNNQHKAGN